MSFDCNAGKGKQKPIYPHGFTERQFLILLAGTVPQLSEWCCLYFTFARSLLHVIDCLSCVMFCYWQDSVFDKI